MLLPLPVIAADYADCLLDNLRGVQNDIAASQVMIGCNRAYPGGLAAVKKATSFLGYRKYTSGPECAVAEAKTAVGHVGPSLITSACYALYEPVPKPVAPGGSMFDDLVPAPAHPGSINDFLGPEPRTPPQGAEPPPSAPSVSVDASRKRNSAPAAITARPRPQKATSRDLRFCLQLGSSEAIARCARSR